MNITLATSQFFPDVYGGVETYTLALATEFQRLGHRVHVVCTRKRASGQTSIGSEDDEYNGVPVRRIVYDLASRSSQPRDTLYNPAIADQVGQALEEWESDIIQITNFSGLSAATIPVVKRSGIPIVWTATDFGMTCARYTLLKWDGSMCPGQATFYDCLDCVRPRSPRNDQLYSALSRLPAEVNYQLAHLAHNIPFKTIGMSSAALVIEHRLKRILPLLQQIDLIVAPSSWMREVLVMNGANPDRIMVSVYGLQTDQSAPPPRKPHSPLRFGFLGRIHSMKGVDVLIDAFNRLPDPRDATLVMYGSPSPDQFEYAGRLWSMAKANPDIALGKQVGQGQLATVFESLDVLVVPSVWYENSPISILEALHHRTPVIASQVAGVADVIQHEVNGLLFRRGDASDLASQMQCLIDNPKLVEQLSSRAQAVKTISQDAEMLLGKYEALLHPTGVV